MSKGSGSEKNLYASFRVDRSLYLSKKVDPNIKK